MILEPRDRWISVSVLDTGLMKIDAEHYLRVLGYSYDSDRDVGAVIVNWRGKLRPVLDVVREWQDGANEGEGDLFFSVGEICEWDDLDPDQQSKALEGS
jgi:hypothetical protein